MRLALALALVVAGCAYQAGSFRSGLTSFDGARLELDCIDLTIARTAVVDATGGTVVRYQFGNRCDAPRTIDLLNVHVVGRTADGRVVKLEPHDPDEELEPLRLDGRSTGAEAIAYRAPDETPLARACVDAASVVHAGTPRWVCVDLTPARAGASTASGNEEDYVGHRERTAFGAWAEPMKRPSLFADWGMAGRSVSVPMTRDAPAQSSLGTITTTARLGYIRPGGLYLGLEGEAGGTGDGRVFIGAYLLTGLRGALGPVSLSAELASGARAVQTQLTDVSAPAPPPAPADVLGEAVIEARVRAEVWLAPWISFGVTAGDNLLDRGEKMGGAYFGFRTRAFGGDRSGRRSK